MSTARLVITAVTVAKRSVAEVVTEYGVSRSWVYELLAHYRAEGENAFQPRSRRPNRSPRATPPATVEQVSDTGMSPQVLCRSYTGSGSRLRAA